MQSLRGIFPQPKAPPKRDFIKENMKSVKQIELRNVMAKSETDLRKINGWQRAARTRNTSPMTKGKPSKTIGNEHGKMQKFFNSREYIGRSQADDLENSRPNSVQSRDASSQTESIDDNYFLKDVIIRLPSASVVEKMRENTTKCGKSKSDFELNLKAAELDDECVEKQNNNGNAVDSEHVDSCIGDCTNMNMKALSVSDLKESHSDNDGSSSNQVETKFGQNQLNDTKDKYRRTRLPSSYRIGEIPKYLKDMKIKMAEKSRLDALLDPNCPADHIALTDEERLEALSIAKKRYQNLIDELNKMPLTSKTLKIRNRQIEIEKELNELDDNIRIFSRQKVYVKIE